MRLLKNELELLMKLAERIAASKVADGVMEVEKDIKTFKIGKMPFSFYIGIRRVKEK